MFDRIILSLILLIGSIPASAAMMAIPLLDNKYEYFLPYLYMGISFPIFSLISGFFVYQLIEKKFKFESTFNQVLVVAMIAYGVSWVCLVFMNSGSLCVGKNNGDGYNTIVDCTIGTVFNGLLISVLAYVGNLPGAILYAYFQRKNG